MKLRMIFNYGFIFLWVLGSTNSIASRLTDLNMGLENADANEDAVVRFGDFKSKRKVSESQARTLEPIEETSYGGATNRAPASVSAEGRNPAVSNELPPKAIIRNLNQRKAVQEVAVIVNDLGFFPSTLFVTQGIPVRLYVTGASKKSQCFMMDSFNVRRQIQSQKVEEITFTPDESGTFAFSCPMNGAKGSMLVKELEMGRMPANVKMEQPTTVGNRSPDESEGE